MGEALSKQWDVYRPAVGGKVIWAELLLKASPLCLIGLGLAIGYRANVWNIGAEGQLTLGAIVGGGVALFWGASLGPLAIPVVLIAGALGGMAWAAIPAWLRTRFNANEILTSLMLTYVAQLILIYLVTGPWRDPEGYGFPQSRMFDDAGTMPILIEGTRLHLGVPIALLVVMAAWVLLGKSLVGNRAVDSTPGAIDGAPFQFVREAEAGLDAMATLRSESGDFQT